MDFVRFGHSADHAYDPERLWPLCRPISSKSWSVHATLVHQDSPGLCHDVVWCDGVVTIHHKSSLFINIGKNAFAPWRCSECDSVPECDTQDCCWWDNGDICMNCGEWLQTVGLLQPHWDRSGWVHLLLACQAGQTSCSQWGSCVVSVSTCGCRSPWPSFGPQTKTVPCLSSLLVHSL